MTRFASKTEVPVEKTRAEIEATVRRYGADGFLSGWEGRKAMVQFRSAGRYVRLNMDLPDPASKEFTEYSQGRSRFLRSPTAARERWDQACRQRWRAMLLLIKAKLEAIESGIVSFEEEFLPHIVMPEGGTVYEHVKARVAIAYETGKMDPLLPPPGGGS